MQQVLLELSTWNIEQCMQNIGLRMDDGNGMRREDGHGMRRQEGNGWRMVMN